jgi:DNA-binding NarL/FixJ family response regulator
MIPKERASSQDIIKRLLPEKPRPSFGRDDNEGGGIDFGRERRVLVVEDDFLIATDAQSALTEAGFTVVAIAASAEEALQIVAVRKPALVIMDIRLMGRRDGIDLALELFRTQGLRSIFATAHIDSEMRRRAEAAQPLGWLPKPYSSASLVALVQRVWNRS